MNTKDHNLTQLLSADTLIGKSVENFEADKIGEIKDLVLDPISGQVSYAVLSVNTGFLNLESKFFAIPLQAMTVTESMVKFNISKDKLEQAPGFDKDVWPTGPQQEFLTSVYAYHNIARNYGIPTQQEGMGMGKDGLNLMTNPDSTANMNETQNRDENLGIFENRNDDKDPDNIKDINR